MAYKINIRNAGNTGWVNLLQAQYHSVLDTASNFSTDTVEAVLAELFTGKAGRVESASAPGVGDDGYLTGAVWINTTNGNAYICTDDATGAAVWINVSAIDAEGIEDVVGGMFPGTNVNITSAYNDANGTIDLTVATATASVLGVAMFPTTHFGVTAGSVSIKAGAITVTELATNIDATAIGFDAAKVNGTAVLDSGTSTSDLWTASKVISYVDGIASGLVWQEPVISIGLDAPPGSPTTADRYVVSAGVPAATGAWVGHDNEIAEWNGTSWDFTTVTEGFALWDQTEDTQQVYNGTVWAKIGTTVTHANLSGLQGGNGTDEYFHLTSAESASLIGSKAAGTVFAAPAGAAGVGGFRALVASDIPDIASTQITSFTEDVQDAAGAMFPGSDTNITAAYNDATNKVDLTVATATTSTLGVAQFDATDFAVTAGVVTLLASGVDHGGLGGLADDDHTQYVHISTARTITAQHTFAPATAIAPFVLNSNAQGVLVTGLNADLLNGQDWTVAATASAPATPIANDIWVEITA